MLIFTRRVGETLMIGSGENPLVPQVAAMTPALIRDPDSAAINRGLEFKNKKEFSQKLVDVTKNSLKHASAEDEHYVSFKRRRDGDG